MCNNNSEKKLVFGEIVSNTQIAPEHFDLKILCPYIASSINPGQFVLIKISHQSTDPLLCRPFAVYKVKDNVIEILYKTVGKGTRLLSGKRSGEILSIVGPLGNGFSIDDSFSIAILVAGGMGIAGLMMLAEKLKHLRIITLIGACSKDKIIGEKDLAEIGSEILVITEDGSCGYKGLVSQMLENLLLKKDLLIQNSCIFACGPIPMIKAVSKIARQNNIRAFVSLEERMACGLGACLGCAYEVISSDGNKQYKMVCVDGPVFSAQEIIIET